MTKRQLLLCIKTLLCEEAYMIKRCRCFKSSERNQRRSINDISKAFGFGKISNDEFEAVKFGCDPELTRKVFGE